MTEKLNIDPDLAIDAYKKAAQLELLRKQIVRRALNLVGTKSIKYVSSEQGMDSDTGFDCSGFISYVIQESAIEKGVNIKIPRHANEQWREFGEFVSYRQRKAGDLVFFPSKTVAGLRVIGHVGIVLDAFSYIHAPGKENTYVIIDELPEEPVQLNTIQPDDIHTHNPAGIKRVTLPIGNGRWHVH